MSSQNNSEDRPGGGRRRWSRGLLILGGLVLIPAVLFVGYLNSVVLETFSGRRWTVPAKVYARPLEVFSGQQLSQADFLIELKALGYRRSDRISGPGLMRVNGSQVELHTRGFQFFDGAEQGRHIRLRFSGDSIASLTDVTQGEALSVARLEPLTIGGIYPAHNEDRLLVSLDQTPPYLLETLVAVEDRDFYSHFGVSPRAITRAFWANLTAGRLVQGGSTLTQQLVKNFFLTSERSLVRKANEAVMAVLLDWHYDKDTILESYLNEVFLGQDGQRAIHGFGLASQYFFNQPLAELQLHQVALLVGMVKGPSAFNPRRHPERALARRNLVLDLLVEQQVISDAEGARFKQKPLDVTPKGSLVSSSFPAFLDLVKRQLKVDYREEDLTEEGLRIFTSFNPILQIKAETALESTLKGFQGRKGADQIEAAMVVTNPETGEVQALLGGRQAGFAGFNRALDAHRAVGSLIKPAIYLTALAQPDRYTLTSPLQDEPFTVRSAGGASWEPKNYDHKAHGEIYLYQGLVNSYNLSTARLGLDLGVPEVLETLRRLGVDPDWPAYPSMLLGAGALSPINVASMYQTLASGGFNIPLRAIRSVLTAQGDPLKRYPFEIEQRFDPGAIYLTQYALQRVVYEGTARSAYNRLPRSLALAGKTGTTNESRDSWFAGFSQDLLAVVWLGRDDNGPTFLTGASGGLKVWTDFMHRADPMPLTPPLPDNVRYFWIDSRTGEGSAESCPGAVKMPYILGSEPFMGAGCGGQHSGTPQRNSADPLGDWIREQLPRR